MSFWCFLHNEILFQETLYRFRWFISFTTSPLTGTLLDNIINILVDLHNDWSKQHTRPILDRHSAATRPIYRPICRPRCRSLRRSLRRSPPPIRHKILLLSHGKFLNCWHHLIFGLVRERAAGISRKVFAYSCSSHAAFQQLYYLVLSRHFKSLPRSPASELKSRTTLRLILQ